MTVTELMEQLTKYPGNAEVVTRQSGDPDVGIWDAVWTTKYVGSDQHQYAADGGDFSDCCVMCGFRKEFHDSAPVVVWMEIDD